MKKLLLIILLFIICQNCAAQYFEGPEWKIPMLFETPRKGYWHLKDWSHDPWDKSKILHFVSGMALQIGIDEVLEHREVKNSTLWSAGITLFLGFAKELEDGNREGFSRRDLMCDGLGQIVGIVLKLGIFDKLEKSEKVELYAYNNYIGINISLN